MPVPVPFVPMSEIFPKQGDDFASFCSLVRTLSRTDTLLWCARLSLILSNPHDENERGKQQYAVAHFFDSEAIGRLNRFLQKHPNARVFFREQLLELIRWTSLLAGDLPGDGDTYENPDMRRRFAMAVLMAGDLWGRRVYRDGLPLTDDRLVDRRRAIVALRDGVVMTAPDIMRVLVRSDAFYRGAFQSGYAEAEAEFLAATRLTMDEYMTCVRNLLIHYAHISPEVVTRAKWGGIQIGPFREAMPASMQQAFDRYLELESQTADELRAGLWGDRRASDVSESEPFDARPLRERPILRTADGRGAIILDHVFYADKASVGPLFALVKALDESGKSGRINEVFEAFGHAFERYINELLRSMYPSSPILPARLICNPHGTMSGGGEVEIADACLNDLREAVLFESKGVFVPDNATQETETYLVALRKKYGAHGGRQRGAAQLGRWLNGLATGTVAPVGQDWTQVQLVYPVLVVHDARMDRPGHAEFLDEEFAKALGPDATMASGYMRKGRFTVAPMTTMTIADLELLESSVDHVRLTDLLRDYAQSGHGGIRESLHDYLAFAKDRYTLSLSKLRARASSLLEEAHKSMFPNIPIPTAPSLGSYPRSGSFPTF
jgi:hypothetical protein